jgi:hypothetical protein
LGNRLKLICMVISVTSLSFGCLAKDSLSENCDMDLFINKFINEDSTWEIVQGDSDFKPIIGLTVFESKLWVSTFGADFFPVTIIPDINSFSIENIRFLRQSPIEIENDPAMLVKLYKEDKVRFKIYIRPKTCELEGDLQLKIYNLTAKEDEILDFIRVDPK